MATHQNDSYADISKSGLALPYARTELERNRDGLLSIMNWIPPSKRSAILAGSGANVQSEFQLALNSGEDISLNTGKYIITDKLIYPAQHQKIVGNGDRAEVIVGYDADAGFNMAASSVVQMSHYGTLKNITLSAAQPRNPSGPAEIKRYPWAIDVSQATRARIHDVQMQRGWRGIYGRGNCGGLDLARIEDGTLECGLLLDGPLDFVQIDSWESWVYLGDLGEYAGLMNYAHNNPGYLHFLRNDGLNVDSIHMWKKRILVDNSASELAATFGTVKMDGGNACMTISGGRVNIGNFNGLVDTDLEPLLSARGNARVVVGTIHAKHADAAPGLVQPLVLVTNDARLIVNGGFITGNTESPEVFMSGGTLNLANIQFDGRGNRSMNAGMVRVAAGRCNITNSAAFDTANGGLFVNFENGEWHNVSGTFFGGRGFRRVPNGLVRDTGNGGISTYQNV